MKTSRATLSSGSSIGSGVTPSARTRRYFRPARQLDVRVLRGSLKNWLSTGTEYWVLVTYPVSHSTVSWCTRTSSSSSELEQQVCCRLETLIITADTRGSLSVKHGPSCTETVDPEWISGWVHDMPIVVVVGTKDETIDNWRCRLKVFCPQCCHDRLFVVWFLVSRHFTVVSITTTTGMPRKGLRCPPAGTVAVVRGLLIDFVWRASYSLHFYAKLKV